MLIEQVDKIMLHTKELKETYSFGVERANPDREFDTDILLVLSGLFSGQKPDRESLLQDKYQECCALLDSPTVDKIILCTSRMVGLAQVFDYVDANLWLGEFSETILGRYDDAGYWFRRAASLGSGTGMFRYGLLLLNRKIQKPNAVSVKRCFTDAVAKGIEEANIILEDSAEELNLAESGEVIPSEILLHKLYIGGREHGLLPIDKKEPLADKEFQVLAYKIGVDLMDIFYTEDNLARLQEEKLIFGVLCESFYAGYGAMALKEERIAFESGTELLENLCEPYGEEKMDEYIAERFGPSIGTKQEQKLREHVIQSAEHFLILLYSFSDNDRFNEQFVYAAEALFYYGVLIRKNTSSES